MTGGFAKGDSYGGEGCHYLPRNQEYTHVWIFMHGLGDTCDGWRPAFDRFIAIEPRIAEDFKIILPTAATRPITLNRGWPMPGWFDIAALDESGLQDEAGTIASADRIQRMIDGELAKGIRNKRIYVGGFSQGAAVAYFVGIRGLEAVGAIVALSGWLPLREKLGPTLADSENKPPVLHCHGTADNMVNFEFGEQTAEVLKEAGFEVSFKSYHNMQHSTCASELADVLEFIKARMK